MIKRWVTFLVLSVLVVVIYIVINNYNTLWDMLLDTPIKLIIAYMLGAITMFISICGKAILRKKHKNSNKESKS